MSEQIACLDTKHVFGHFDQVNSPLTGCKLEFSLVSSYILKSLRSFTREVICQPPHNLDTAIVFSTIYYFDSNLFVQNKMVYNFPQ